MTLSLEDIVDPQVRKWYQVKNISKNHPSVLDINKLRDIIFSPDNLDDYQFIAQNRYFRSIQHLSDFCTPHAKILDIGGGENVGSIISQVFNIPVDYQYVNSETDIRTDPLPFLNDYFDIVISWETIEHLWSFETGGLLSWKGIENFWRESNRVLKNTGTFFLSTSNRFCPRVYRTFMMGLLPQVYPSMVLKPGHIREFTGDELRQLAKSLQIFTKNVVLSEDVYNKAFKVGAYDIDYNSARFKKWVNKMEDSLESPLKTEEKGDTLFFFAQKKTENEIFYCNTDELYKKCCEHWGGCRQFFDEFIEVVKNREDNAQYDISDSQYCRLRVKALNGGEYPVNRPEQVIRKQCEDRIRVAHSILLDGFQDEFPINIAYRIRPGSRGIILGGKICNELDGHHRLAIAKFADIKKIPVQYKTYRSEYHNITVSEFELQKAKLRKQTWYQHVDFGRDDLNKTMEFDVKEEFSGLRKIDRFYKYLPDIKRRRILDVGCNSGAVAIELAKRGAAVYAVDKSSEIEQARFVKRMIANEWYYPLFNVVNLNKQPIMGGFDIVLLLNVLYYLDDPRKLLEQLYPKAGMVVIMCNPTKQQLFAKPDVVQECLCGLNYQELQEHNWRLPIIIAKGGL